MREHWDVLVASSCMEDRGALLRILDGLSLNVISCSAVDQAREVLSREEIPLAFCDEHLADGCYQDLLASRPGHRPPRVVVIVHTNEWDEYLATMRHGAFDAIRFPLQPTDVELMVLRAQRENREFMSHRMSA